MTPLHQKMLVPLVSRNLLQECPVFSPVSSDVPRGRLSPVNGRRGGSERAGKRKII